MHELWPGQAFGLDLLEAQLDGRIAVPLDRLLLSHEARPRLDDGHGYDPSAFVEYARHANFLPQDAFHLHALRDFCAFRVIA